MRFGSICSGIEAASAAWEPLGWRASFLSEIDPFARAVLSHHYPNTPLHGDFTTIQRSDYGSIDVLVGGTPCQSFSVAGLRAGLQDARGNLALEFCRLVERLQPRWIIWENVPGVLSSNGGRDFGSILGALVQLGYGVAYRICDAQFFGVPQRRRRVFVVGYFGDAKRAAQVLFDGDGVCRHTHESAKAWKNAAALTANGVGTCGADDNQAQANHLIGLSRTVEIGPSGACFTQVSPTLDTRAKDGPIRNQIAPAVLFSLRGRDGESQIEVEPDGVAPALRAVAGGSSHTFVATSAVRRITPIEAERLQGFPDNHTLVPYRGKPAADGPRYKAIGNSMAVPVMAWIGRRIAVVQERLNAE